MSPNFWLMLKNYYEVMVMFVKCENGEFSDPFGATVGVNQDGNASRRLESKKKKIFN